MTYFSHAGHDHETPAVTPTPTTATPEPVLSEQPYPSVTTAVAQDKTMTNSLPPDVFIGGSTLLGLIIIWLLVTYIFKLKLATRLGFVMAALLVIGMFGYQYAPVTSIVALTLGISIALVTALTQLGSKKTPKQPTKV